MSVRLDKGTCEALDAVVERTGRSRGFYLREAIREHLPLLLERYWAHGVATSTDEDQAFLRLIKDGLLGPDAPADDDS